MKIYTIIPPSPEVSALLEYSVPDVDQCTGQPSIALPIYTLRQGTLELPISIGYQSGGVRMMQEVSTAGLSWRLDCGASIGRTVIGKPDELNGNNTRGMMYMTETTQKFRNNLLNIEAEHNPFDINYLLGEYNSTSILATEYYEGRADMANDIFNLAGCGLNATFIYDYSSGVPKATVSSRNGLKIIGTPTSHPYTVIDARGIEYTFGQAEWAFFTNHYGSPQLTQLVDTVLYKTAWHLTRICNANGDSIKLKYTERPRRYHDSGSSMINYTSDKRVGAIPTYQTTCNSAIYFPWVLSEAESDSHRVEFHYRQVLTIDLLDRIEIHAKDAANTLLRKIVFQYGRPTTLNHDNSFRSRRMLTSVTDNDEKLYEFDYYDVPMADNTVDYAAQDFGGFYNGRDSNNGLILEPDGGGTNRDVDGTAAKYLSLKSITYPTGGRTEFVWESHDVGYINKGEVTVTGGSATSITTVNYTLCALTEPTIHNLQIDNFVVGHHSRVTLDLTQYFAMADINYLTSEYEERHYFDLHNQYPKVVFYDSKGKTDQYRTFFIDKYTVKELHGDKPFDISLAAGTYTVKLEYPTSVNRAEDNMVREFNSGASSAGRVHIQVKHSLTDFVSDIKKQIWCGLRIKRMVSYSLADTVYRDFMYPKLDMAESSGVAKTFPNYFHHWYYGTSHPTVSGEIWAEIESTGSAGFANSPIGEPMVQYRMSVSTMGRTEWFNADSYLGNSQRCYAFTTAADPGCQDFNYTPYLTCQPVGARMNTSMAFRRGLPVREWTPYQLGFSETTRDYNIYIGENNPTFTTEPFVISDYSTAPYNRSGACIFYGIGRYTLFPHNITVKSEDILTDNGAAQRKTYGYFYTDYTDKPDFANRHYQRQTLSDGDSVTTYHTYRNTSWGFFSPDVETAITVRKGKIVSAVRNKYNPGTSLIETTYTLSRTGVDAAAYISFGQATPQNLINLISTPLYSYKYDTAGRLVQINYRGRVLASYLWGYRGAYPVIEAQGVAYEAVVALLGTAQVKSLTDSLSAITQGSLNTLRSRIAAANPGKEVAAYTYHWLFGILTKTDSRSRTNAFDYDGRGRLTSISDFNNYLIKKYDYSSHWNQNN